MNRQAIRIYKALGDPSRVRIVKLLEHREMCVCEVREVLGFSVSTVSKHLSILRDAELITDSKDGKWVNYRLNSRSADSLVKEQLKLVRKSFADDEQVKADEKKLKGVDRNDICHL